ncbi:MAG: carboxyl-terminal protease [Deltaproteobacteria bacterium]|nr:carboxyl-terminal protease [Deltaproteobacteria bacterium]
MRIGPFCFLAVLLLLTQGATAAPVEEIVQILRSRALDPPPESVLQTLTESNLAEGLRQIDPYARYFRPEEYRSPLSGYESWVGIGAELVPQGQNVLLSLYYGGAAEGAGIADRSRLVAIDGEKIAGWDLHRVAARLRGEAGSVIRLTLAAPGGRQETFSVTREPFRPLDVEMVPPGDLKVLRIRDFIGGLTRSALLATVDFVAATAKEGKDFFSEHLIIDLRESSGGDLYEALDTAGLFLPAGTALATLRRSGGEKRSFFAPGQEKLEMPLVFLVGPDTASAAEILAGVLRYHGRARLVGQRTYGKCTSQTDQVLSDGSILRYTNSEILFPDGTSCSGVGLVPEVVVSDQDLNLLSRLAERALGLPPQ